MHLVGFIIRKAVRLLFYNHISKAAYFSQVYYHIYILGRYCRSILTSSHCRHVTVTSIRKLKIGSIAIGGTD